MTKKVLSKMRKVDVAGVCCSNCGSGNVVGHGVKKTQKHGVRQRYFCNDCIHTFYKQEEIEK